jgi:hypothetical protein
LLRFPQPGTPPNTSHKPDLGRAFSGSVCRMNHARHVLST